MEKILPILGLVFVCLPILGLIVSILRYNVLNKKNVILQVFGILTIIAGGLVFADKIYVFAMQTSMLGFTGYTVCLSFLFVLTLSYAFAVYFYREIATKDDFRPTILATALLMFGCFVFYIVNSILHILAYNYIAEYCAFIFMLISAIGLGSQKKQIVKYCRKNSVDYKVLTSRKPEDAEFNAFWLEFEQEQAARKEIVFNKADYEKMKIARANSSIDDESYVEEAIAKVIGIEKNIDEKTAAANDEQPELTKKERKLQEKKLKAGKEKALKETEKTQGFEKSAKKRRKASDGSPEKEIRTEKDER